MNRKTIFFDFDGTLVSSVDALKEIYHSFLLLKKVPQNEILPFEIMNGKTLKEIIQAIPSWHKNFDSVYGEYLAAIDRYYDQEAEFAFGGQDIIEAAIQKSYRIAVVSSGSKIPIKKFFLRKGFKNIFIVGSEDVKNGKPSPEAYLIAHAEFQDDLNETLIVEDSIAGLKSAMGAGYKKIFHIVGKNEQSSTPDGCIQIKALWELKNWIV